MVQFLLYRGLTANCRNIHHQSPDVVVGEKTTSEAEKKSNKKIRHILQENGKLQKKLAKHYKGKLSGKLNLLTIIFWYHMGPSVSSSIITSSLRIFSPFLDVTKSLISLVLNNQQTEKLRAERKERESLEGASISSKWDLSCCELLEQLEVKWSSFV